MLEQEPATELDPQFSSPDATATPWKEVFGFGKSDAYSQTRWRFSQ